MAVVLRAVRGKSSNIKTSLKTAADDSAQLEKKNVTISQTLSASTSSLGSEMLEEGPLDSPRKVVQGVPDKHQISEDVEPSEPVHHPDEPAEDRDQSAVVEKPRNPSRVSTVSWSLFKLRVIFVCSATGNRLFLTQMLDTDTSGTTQPFRKRSVAICWWSCVGMPLGLFIALGWKTFLYGYRLIYKVSVCYSPYRELLLV